MRKLSIIKLSQKELDNLLHDPRWQLDSSILDGDDVYRHPDGRALVLFKIPALRKKARLFNTATEFEEFIEGFEDLSKEPEHLLSGILPQGREFIDHVPALVKAVPDILSAPSDSLDGSFESLSLLDQAIKKVGTAQCLTEEVFPALVAYVGEVIRLQTNGTWQMAETEAQDIWEPWIVGEDGRKHPPFGILYKELFESGPFSIAGSVCGQIGKSLVG